MKILDVEQGSEAWKAARRGIPTASQFHRILSPARLKISDSSFGYACELVAERLLGEDIGQDATAFMERGSLLEQEAIAYYEFQAGVETTKVGLCLSDDERVGCSPDRLVGKEGGLELKCPSAAVHVGYLLSNMGDKYRLQVQGALWITGRKWWDLLSYNPDLPTALIRCYPDAEVFDALDQAIPVFCEELDRFMNRLRPETGSKDGRGASAPVAQESAVSGIITIPFLERQR